APGGARPGEGPSVRPPPHRSGGGRGGERGAGAAPQTEGEFRPPERRGSVEGIVAWQERLLDLPQATNARRARPPSVVAARWGWGSWPSALLRATSIGVHVGTRLSPPVAAAQTQASPILRGWRS